MSRGQRHPVSLGDLLEGWARSVRVPFYCPPVAGADAASRRGLTPHWGLSDLEHELASALGPQGWIVVSGSGSSTSLQLKIAAPSNACLLAVQVVSPDSMDGGATNARLRLLSFHGDAAQHLRDACSLLEGLDWIFEGPGDSV